MGQTQKFVVWDWNGTLLDDTELVRACVNEVLVAFKRPAMDIATFRKLQTRPLRNFYLAAGMGEDEVEQALERERNMFDDKYEQMVDDEDLREGAPELLRKLHGNNVDNVILSNHITHHIVRLLEQHGIRAYFGDVIAYPGHAREYRGVTKGAKLRDFIKERGLTGSNAVIIGDTIEEIEIAREQGMTSIAITGGIHSEERLRALNPDYIAHTMNEIAAALQEREFVS